MYDRDLASQTSPYFWKSVLTGQNNHKYSTWYRISELGHSLYESGESFLMLFGILLVIAFSRDVLGRFLAMYCNGCFQKVRFRGLSSLRLGSLSLSLSLSLRRGCFLSFPIFSTEFWCLLVWACPTSNFSKFWTGTMLQGCWMLHVMRHIPK